MAFMVTNLCIVYWARDPRRTCAGFIRHHRRGQRSWRFDLSMEESSAVMPTYEYLCQSCGSRFEAWQKITDDPIDTCPTCGKPVRRIIFPVGLVFKGSGFYINDARSVTSAAVPEPNGSSASEPKSTEPASAKPSATDSSSAGDSAASSSTAPPAKSSPTPGTSGK